MPPTCPRSSFLLGIALALLPGCPGASDGDPPIADATTGESTAADDGTATSSSEPGAQGGSGVSSSGDSESEVTSGAESTGATSSSPSPSELCRTATSEDECSGLDDTCRWYPSYRVVDAATCMLEEPEYGCWATFGNQGQAGCFDGPPMACAELELRPLYREVDGMLQLVLNTEWICGYNPIAPPGEAGWTECPIDEFRPAPEACYCLCGQDGGSGSG